MKPPKTIWLLVDVSNSDLNYRKARNYVWWFRDRLSAIEYLKYHRGLKMKYKATLKGPFKYERAFNYSDKSL